MVVLVLLLSLATIASAAAPTESELLNYLKTDYETQASAECTKANEASWNYDTNITPANAERMEVVSLENAKFEKQAYLKWFKDVQLDDIKDSSAKRMMKDLKIQGQSALSDEDLKTLTSAVNKMTALYSSATVCPFGSDTCPSDKAMNLDPDIETVLAKVENYDEMLDLWTKWHDASGKKMRDDYKTYVDLNNKMARDNGFADYGKYWQNSFETVDFVNEMDKIWAQIEPLYQALHKYAGKKLKAKFTQIPHSSEGYLPAHIFGNMWAQTWENLDSLLKPYPHESPVDITAALKKQNYTELDMFKKSNEFYMGLGLPTNEMSYGAGSMIVRPKGRNVTCHASAWDFCNKKKFLIKMCTKINQADFYTIHHEMGHINYFILYKDQPYAFRAGANPGFHEAVGDTIALSVQSVPHLKKIGLVNINFVQTDKAGLNTLMSMALQKVAFLPFGLLIDKWRWDVFAEVVPESEWNAHWWKLREKYQMITSALPRNETYFDPGAKFHVPADSQYISYFVSHILQFQFYKALCIAAGKYDAKTKNPPLYECDFADSKDAGNLLKQGLSLGMSRPWPEVLEIMTGTRSLDASAFLEYFEPLHKYFEEAERTGSAAGLQGSILLSILTFTIGLVIQYIY